MKIVIATPLYPPDIAEPAPYIKTLASKLAEHHEVIIVLYGRLPESVQHVRYVCIDKRTILPLRLMRYMTALIREARHADIVYVENGASTELPAIITSLLLRVPFIFHIGDQLAHARMNGHWTSALLERIARRLAHDVIETLPQPRPELLPFEPYPQKAFDTYEKAWNTHINNLNHIFTHART